MTRAPLVSVLVPARDEEERVGEALRSLSEQTLADFEAIVVDDGSTDATAEVVERHARHDPRVRLVRQAPAGFAAASERGRAEARGRYVAALGADDRARPRRLEAQVEALESEGLAAVGGGVAFFSAGGVTDGMRRYAAWLNSLTTSEAAERDLWVECPLAHPALAVRADALAAAGGYREVAWPEDYDLVLRLWARGGRFRNVDEVVLDWRDHPRRLSRVDPRYGLDAFARCKAHHLRDGFLRGRPVAVWGAGPVGKLHARELLAAGVEVSAFVEVDPRKIGKRIYGVPVVDHGDGPRGGVALGAVAGASARERLRELARAQGRVEGEDFVAVA